MKKNDKKQHTLFKLDQLVENYEKDRDLSISENINFRNVLLKENETNNLLGIAHKSGFRPITRYSLPDFYYDLLKNISHTETKLINEGKLELEHYLYQQIQKKAVNGPLKEQMNEYVTLIYAQNNAAPHWNKSSELAQHTVNDIIFEECLNKGINSFNILTKIFSPEQFLNAEKRNKTQNNKFYTLNLYEALTLHMLAASPNEIKPFLDLHTILKELGATIDYKKIKTLKLISPYAVRYDALLTINDENINNLTLSANFSNSKAEAYTLKDFVHYYEEKEVLNKLILKGNYASVKDSKNKLIKNNSWVEVNHLISEDIKDEFKTQFTKNFQNNFNKITPLLHYQCLNTLENDNINLLSLPEKFKQTNGQPYTLKEYSRDIFLLKSLVSIVNKGYGEDLEGKTYNNLKEFKAYLITHNFLENVQSMLHNNIDTNNNKKNGQIPWSVISLELKLADIPSLQSTNKLKI